MASHVRQKLHCAQLERAELEGEVGGLLAQAAECRAQLAGAKAHKERCQREREALAEDWRIVSDRRCLADMAEHRERLASLQRRATALQACWELGRLGAGGG